MPRALPHGCSSHEKIAGLRCVSMLANEPRRCCPSILETNVKIAKNGFGRPNVSKRHSSPTRQDLDRIVVGWRPADPLLGGTNGRTQISAHGSIHDRLRYGG